MKRLAQLACLLLALPAEASLHIIGSSDVPRSSPGVVVVTAQAGEVVVPKASTVKVKAGSGTTVIENVAAVSVTKPSGQLEVRGVAGNVDIEMLSGNATVTDVGSVVALTSTANLEATNVRGDVTVTSINGRTTLSCVGGSVAVTDNNGVIELNATRGDVVVKTTSGRATWTGVPLASRRYELKTLSGVVTFKGFGPRQNVAVSLSTHAGRISTNVALPEQKRDGHGRLLRVWSSGSGPQITLDAFDGNVELEWNEKGDEDENCTSAVGGPERGGSGARAHGE